MDTNTLLLRFDGRSRLLVRSLLSGATGARRALCVFLKQRRSEPDSCLHTCLQTLCQHEIFPTTEAETLKTKPLVCLFPMTFQQNLLSFLHLVHPELPQAGVFRLLDCLSGAEPVPNPWVPVLVAQLRRDLGAPGGNDSLFSPQCRDELRGLCERLKDGGKATRWASYLDAPIEPLLSSTSQRKRKCNHVDLDSEHEGSEPGSKRKKLSLSPAVEGDGIRFSTAAGGVSEGLEDEMDSGRDEDGSTEVMACLEHPQPTGTVNPCDSLPEHLQASIPQIRELLQSETEWDQSSVDVLKVLNDCDPSEVELLCGMLDLSETPEQTLPQLCSCLLLLSPDLSHSTAATLIKNLLLGKVMSLSEPASRCLVSAVTSLCRRYPRPMCQALIGPVLDSQPGSAQTELLNRLIEDCLDPHYRLLVFHFIHGLIATPKGFLDNGRSRMALQGIWSEGVLAVIHTLLDKKLELNDDLLTLFTEQLSTQAPHFVTSMMFAKMMLTVLTKYNMHLTAVHQNTLSCCLPSNKTFLKKSLQAALKRITHS